MLSRINKHRTRGQNARKKDSSYSNKFGCDRENRWNKTAEKCVDVLETTHTNT